MFEINSKHKELFKVIVFVIWLFQISGIIGVTMGFQDWFIPKTPLLLCINGMMTLFYLAPLNRGKIVSLFLTFFGGMIVEWIGVHHDFLFGAYYYGENLGPKIYGVPWLIGLNWMVLVLITNSIGRRFFRKIWQVALVGASLMVFLDFFIEKSAPPFDFWIWENGDAPLRNYVSWFLIAFALQWGTGALTWAKENTSSLVKPDWHLYFSQIVFFVYFYVYHSI